MKKNLTQIKQFTYGVINLKSNKTNEGLFTVGLSQCRGFVATAYPKEQSQGAAAAGNYYHMLCHMDAKTSIRDQEFPLKPVN